MKTQSEIIRDIPEQPRLLRRFGLLEATALNMTNMIGIGPFITIPLLSSTLGGPQAMLGWLVQFVGQILAVSLLRRNEPEMSRPYRVWLYPLPNLVALAGWIFVFATTDWPIIFFGIGTLGLGLVCFIIWSLHTRQWPFAWEPQGGLR